MHRANREIRLARGNTFAYLRGTRAPALSASLGVAFLLSACGGSGAGHSGGGNEGGRGGLTSSGNSEEVEIEPDVVVQAATDAAALSEDELQAALAAADLENEMALSGPSGLSRELGGEALARAAWALVGAQAKAEADALAEGLFGTQETQSAPRIQWPGVRPQASGAGSAAEAFGAGWLGGSLFNALFVQSVMTDYSNGKSGSFPGGSGDVKATAALTDTSIYLDATMDFSKAGLRATIAIHSKIPCPDVTGLIVINSSLDVTGQAGNAYQHARFTFELLVDVDDDAKLTGHNQLTSRTEYDTADSSKGYDVTNGSADVSVTEFADGSFGDAKGTYQGMTEAESTQWMTAGLMSGILYRRYLLPELPKMLDAGRCVAIMVEPSAGPRNLEPFSNVDLLTKPRAKLSSNGDTTGGTVKATFKKNAGGAITESGEKVPADATFHYIAPLDYAQTETVTFEARSKRGTGKLDYDLTTSPHAD